MTAEVQGAPTLRPARETDAAAITEVFLASRAAAMPYLPRLYTDEQTLAWVVHVVLPTGRTWVAEAAPSGDVVGFAVLVGGELEHLYLHPDVQRRGLGTRLLDLAREASPAGLRLRVFTRNTAARAFYEHHGFRPVDENDGSRNEENEPDMTYVLAGQT